MAAWSEKKRENLHWYVTTEVINGQVVLKVYEKYHDYKDGSYTVHTYVDYVDGSVTGFNLETYDLKSAKSNVILPAYFIDISSHNGNISVDDFKNLKQQGILGVVVKLTEETSYINPYAKGQITNAKTAGLVVSAYHFSRYTNATEARQEANYFVKVAKSYGLLSTTLMVNDVEDSDMIKNINANIQSWSDKMKKLGYSNLIHYTAAGWLSTKGGSIDVNKFGKKTFGLLVIPKAILI